MTDWNTLLAEALEGDEATMERIRSMALHVVLRVYTIHTMADPVDRIRAWQMIAPASMLLAAIEDRNMRADLSDTRTIN